MRHADSRDHSPGFANDFPNWKDESRSLREDMEQLKQENKRLTKSLQDAKTKLDRADDNYRQV
jgi:hypothetical protein